MAIAEYAVIAQPQSRGGRYQARTWNGAAAGAQILDINFKDAKYLIVEAESAAEAIVGVKQLYPTIITDTTKAVLLSSMTTG
jgi:hypothetical protein